MDFVLKEKLQIEVIENYNHSEKFYCDLPSSQLFVILISA